jgi:hypothetical protein
MTGESCESGFPILCGSYAEEKDESFPAHMMGARALGVVAVLGPICWFDLSSGTGQRSTVDPMVRVAPNEDVLRRSCRSDVRALRLDGKHQSSSGLTRHTQVTEHRSDPTLKRSTHFDLTACGSCRRDQHKSFLKMYPASRARIEQSGPMCLDPHAAKPRGGQATGKGETDGT